MSDRDKIIEVMARAGATFEEVEYDKYRELFNEQAAHVLAAFDAAGLAVVPAEDVRREALEEAAKVADVEAKAWGGREDYACAEVACENIAAAIRSMLATKETEG